VQAKKNPDGTGLCELLIELVAPEFAWCHAKTLFETTIKA
jgi:hypothetical protein